jgi:hypothetical protein
MKKCPPGVICIANLSMLFILILLLFIVYLIHISLFRQNIQSKEKIIVNNVERNNTNNNGWLYNWLPSWPYSNLPNDALLNPYAPPLRDERYFIPSGNFIPPGAVPINISTNIGAVDTTYRQLGIITATNTNGKILPLMGRPLFTNRDKWQYYTMNDSHNSVKLPVSRNGRSCTNEYGCDRLFNGDTIYIDGINEVYRVTMYDNDTIKYLPFV